jgi:ApbE superfamily uncharacterized protein (UPF0280 family)
MDPISVTAAALIVKVLDQFAADAGKHAWSGFTKLMNLVRQKFSGDPTATTALAAAQAAPADQQRVDELTASIDKYVRDDPQFKSALAELVKEAESDPTIGEFVTEVSGNAQVGKIVNINEVKGDVSF